MRAKVGRWGGSLAVRVPNEIAADFGLEEGESVDVSMQGADVVIRRLKPELTLDAIFEGRPSGAWRAMYRDHFDWGPDVGREIVEE